DGTFVLRGVDDGRARCRGPLPPPGRAGSRRRTGPPLAGGPGRPGVGHRRSGPRAGRVLHTPGRRSPLPGGNRRPTDGPPAGRGRPLGPIRGRPRRGPVRRVVPRRVVGRTPPPARPGDRPGPCRRGGGPGVPLRGRSAASHPPNRGPVTGEPNAG